MKNKQILVVVGSTNPVKIQACKKAFNKAFENVIVKGIKVDSGVADQPMSFKESFKGALNRVKEIIKSEKNIDFAVGIEGGIQKYSFGSATAGVVVMISKKGIIGKGISSQLFLPEKVLREIKKGKELGTVLDEISLRENVKQKEGAFGLFTNKIVTRESVYIDALVCAMSRFIKKDLF
ncbi:inosine/xanthosine triphosphatase [Patescibacteria group bacterium]